MVSIHLPFKLVILVALLVSSSGVSAQDRDDSRMVVRDFQSAYQQFVDGFRLLEDPLLRDDLIREYQAKLLADFSGYSESATMAKLLPELSKVRLLKLDSLFTDTFEKNPDEKIKALSLYSFAKYCGNNHRDEKAIRCFELLKEYFGDLKHGDGDFAKAADNAIYYLKNLAVGKKAPMFAGEDTDGVLFRLEDYEGKVVMLRFWGDWCPACRAMYPFERDIVEKYKTSPFALIGINSDSLEQCQQAQERENLVWRHIWDGGDTSGPTSRIFQVTQWPTIIVIDSNGVIRMRTQGLAEDQLSELLEKLIDEAS